VDGDALHDALGVGVLVDGERDRADRGVADQLDEFRAQAAGVRVGLSTFMASPLP
jgi:hypothetical protein